MLTFTFHATYRAARRNLSETDIPYVFAHGQCFHCAGALIYFLRRKDLPELDRAQTRFARLEGTALVLSRDGHILMTAWRNRQNGLKRIKQKVAYSVEL